MKDYLIKAIDISGNIRVYVARTSDLVEEARSYLESSATVTAALGRSLTAGVIMGSMMKNKDDLLTLRIQGGGPIGNILVSSDSRGRVKGYVTNPKVDRVQRDDGKLDVSAIVGNNGYLTVTRDLGLREPYIGQAELLTGEIAEDIAAYYAVSEQIPSAVGLGVLVDKDLSVKSAGGFIIQLLPGVSEEEIDYIENALAKIRPISKYIEDGLSPEEILEEILPDFEMKILDKLDVKYTCDCSLTRVKNTIASLNIEELEKILKEDRVMEVSCHFCNKKYNLSGEDLEKIILDKK